ncbi:MAG: carbohydrate porin [Phycisphaerales bacterium]|nr:carbohydrate porin [Phycisphaerales bacterium]
MTGFIRRTWLVTGLFLVVQSATGFRPCATACWAEVRPVSSQEATTDESSGASRKAVSPSTTDSGVRPNKPDRSLFSREEGEIFPQDPVPAFDLEGKYLLGNWGGTRDELKGKGISFNVLGVMDFVDNFAGGYEQGAFALSLLNVSASVETEKLLGFEGGEFFTSFQYGRRIASESEYVGSYWGFDGIDADVLQLSELSYRQSLADGSAWVLVGKTDGNNYFSNLGPVGNFLNSAASYSSVLNPYMPSFPNQAFGFEFGVMPIENLELRMAWLDGSNIRYDPSVGQLGPSTGGRGPASFFTNSSFYLDWEIEYGWSLGAGREGGITAGAFLQTGEVAFFGVDSLANLQDVTTVVENPFGFYVDMRQRIFDPQNRDKGGSSKEGITLFGQVAWGNPGTNPVLYSLTAGVECAGVVPGRPHDSFGALVGFSKFTDNPGIHVARNQSGTRVGSGGHEIDFEIYYQFQVTPWLAIQPDLQVIGSPSGGSPAVLDDAIVGTLRFLVSF